MPISAEDHRDVLYEITTAILQPGARGEHPAGLDVALANTRRGMVQFNELVLHSLDPKHMSLAHLVVVANQALKQVKGQWGMDSEEYKGGLFALAGLLGFAKGGDAALRHSHLAPYHPG